MGWLGLAASVILAALTAWILPTWWLGVAAVLAWGSWAIELRPRVGLTSQTLVLRGIGSITRLPLGRVRKLAVQQVFAVWVGEKRYVSPAVGRSRRQVLRPRKAVQGRMHPADAVEDAVRAAMRDTVGTAEPVTRTWDWPVIAVGVAALALLALLLAS